MRLIRKKIPWRKNENISVTCTKYSDFSIQYTNLSQRILVGNFESFFMIYVSRNKKNPRDSHLICVNRDFRDLNLGWITAIDLIDLLLIILYSVVTLSIFQKFLFIQLLNCVIIVKDYSSNHLSASCCMYLDSSSRSQTWIEMSEPAERLRLTRSWRVMSRL